MLLNTKQKTVKTQFVNNRKNTRLKKTLPVFLIIGLLAAVTFFSLAANLKQNPCLKGELPYPVIPPPYSDEELGFFEQSIAGLLEQHRFNGTALLARKGMIIYRGAHGYADFRNRTPLAVNTPFQLASITKTFTATAVLLLHEEGLIDIDDTLVQHIPEFPYPRMTIRQMLNHTSGIQNYMWLVERHWIQKHKPGNEEVLQLFVSHKRPVNFAAGSRFEYSNTGYAFLALLVERVSGQSFADFMEERIFQPLEMHDTFVYSPDEPLRMSANRAMGFRPGRSNFIFNPDLQHDAVYGDKGLYSTVDDLYKWDQAINRRALLKSATWQMAFEPTVVQNRDTIEYGLGWRLHGFLDGRVVHHPGRWNGFRTSFKRFVDGRATLILLANNGQSIAGLVEDMQNLIFSQEIMLMDEQTTEDPDMSENEDPSFNGLPIPPSE